MKTYQITRLDKEKWKGHVLPVEYTTSEYYDVSKTASSDGFLISLRRKKFTSPVRHYPEEYDFPDKLYQDHWQGAEAFGVLESGRLIAAIELYRESWANRLRVTELWVDEAEKKKLIAESRQVHAERKTQQLEDRQKQIQRETAPLQAAAEVLQEYSDGRRKLNKKDLPIIAAEVAKLKAENGQLEERLQISARDQSDVFNLYQKSDREKQALQSDADVLREIREHAPDKLQEVMETVRQRKLDKYSPKPFKSSGNHWSK